MKPERNKIIGRWAELYQTDLYRFARFTLGSAADAEDTVQDLFVRLASSSSDISAVASPRSFLIRSLRNLCIDRQRRRSLSVVPLSDKFDVAEENEAEVEVERIKRLLRELPAEQSEVIMMRTAQHLSFAEIAEVLDVPISTAKSRFTYGIDKVRKMLNDKK
ncbi:MAG: RNA polymerase sigma factor [Tidjanibacter sp.]|nr:RNA polymerase sigma factor [Tidjanibacter sp.]